MAITDADRHQLHERLDAVLGREEAAVLMEHLPPVGWADIATKRDLDHLEASLRGEFTVGFTSLSAEFTAFQVEMRGEFTAFQAEMRGEFAAFQAEIRTEMQEAMNRLLLQLLAAMATFVTIVLVVSQLP